MFSFLTENNFFRKLIIASLTFLITSIIIPLLIPSIAEAKWTWQPTNGPYGGKIKSLARDSDNYVYAGLENGHVFKTTNGGTNWYQSDQGLSSYYGYINELAIDSNNNIYALTYWGNGIYKSTNRGVNWYSPGYFFYYYTSSMVIDSNNYLYVGTYYDGIFKSTNGGTDWTNVSSTSDILTMTIDSNNYIYAGGYFTDKVIKTTNGGTNWYAVNSGLTGTWIQTLGRDFNNYLYAGTDTDVFKSTNGGVNWFSTNTGITGSVYAFISDSTNNIYAGTYANGIYKTTNGGGNWYPVNTGVSNNKINILVRDTNDYIYAGTDSGLFKTTNGGLNWSQNSLRALTYSIGRDLNGHLYAGFESGIAKTTNGGTNWFSVSNGLTTDCLDYGVYGGFDYDSSNNVYANTGYGIFKTTNGGSSWFTLLGTFIGSYTYGLPIGVDSNNYIYASPGYRNSSEQWGLVKSTNGGINWFQLINLPNYQSIKTLTIDSNNSVYAANDSSDVYKSTNGGSNWMKVSNGLPENDYIEDLVVDSNNYIYTGLYYNGIYKTTNGGSNWFPVNNGVTQSYIGDLLVDLNNNIYACSIAGYGYGETSGDYIFKSTNGGNSWSHVTDGLGTNTYYWGWYSNLMEVDLSNNIYACGTNGVYKGYDDGIPNTSPVVTNVTASQAQSGEVNISYNLSDAEQSVVSLDFQYWDGTTWKNCWTTTGEGSIPIGSGKTGAWDASIDVPNSYIPNCEINVIANDEVGGTGMAVSPAFVLDTRPESQPPTGSITINSGNAYTTTSNVTLNFNATDNSGVSELIVSESSSFTGTSWTSYVSTMGYTLSAGEGGKTVYAKFRDIYQNPSQIVSDSIIYDKTAPAGSISINSGEERAHTQDVTLTLLAQDQTSGMYQMVISNDASFTGATWEAYAPTKAWVLSSGEGEKTVYVKYKDKAGNVSGAYSDKIILEKATSRLYGQTRYETAVAISKSGWNSSTYVVLARGDLFPDALAGASLAAEYSAPMLLTYPKSLTTATKEEISRLKATKVIILGSEDAVSTQVADDLKNQLGITDIKRFGGATRYETAGLIAQELSPPVNKTAFVATGENYPDALASASSSAYKGMPILLVRGDIGQIPQATQDSLKKLGITHTIITGGADVVPSGIENWFKTNGYDPVRLGGETRYDTCKLIADYGLSYFSMSSNVIAVAVGENFPDALTVGPLAGKSRASLLLTRETFIPKATKDFIEANKSNIYQLLVAGGPDVVSDKVAEEIWEMIK